MVPYTYDAGFAQKAELEAGAAAWNAVTGQTGVRFVKRTNQKDYLKVHAGQGCYSYMGMQGGEQELSLGQGCDTGAAIHELGHALGMIHEHTRPDRDQYIQMNWSNIVGGQDSQFAKVNLGVFQGGVHYSEYDYKSIMHYRAYGYGSQYVKDSNQPLYKSLNPNFPEDKIHNDVLSPMDISGVKKMYDGFGDTSGGDTGGNNDNCPSGKCSDYGMSQGECKALNTGSYVCENECLVKVASCGGTNPNPDSGDKFTCKNGNKINSSYVCDGVQDCSDGSDEDNCSSATSLPARMKHHHSGELPV